jgi:hypothetical protein
VWLQGRWRGADGVRRAQQDGEATANATGPRGDGLPIGSLLGYLVPWASPVASHVMTRPLAMPMGGHGMAHLPPHVVPNQTRAGPGCLFGHLYVHV